MNMRIDSPVLAPCRVVTLLEILEVKADAFCRMSSMIGQFIIVLNSNCSVDTGEIGRTLGELQREAKKLELRSVDQQLYRIRERVGAGIDNKTMQCMVTVLYDRLLDELNDRFFLNIASDDVKFYKQSEPLFGENVETKLSKMSEDISEAGKCIALNRSTAAVFHLMRVMEIAGQKFGDTLGVSLASEKNWQNILNEVNKTIKSMDQKADLTKIYASISSHLYNVKVASRNEVMHPKQTYTYEEARTVLSSVDIFIRDLAELI